MDVDGVAGVNGCQDVGEVEVPHGADAVGVAIAAVAENVWLLVAVVGAEAGGVMDDGRVWKSMRDRRTTIRKRDRACAD